MSAGAGISERALLPEVAMRFSVASHGSKRLENGGGSFNCSDASTSCAAGSPTGTPAMLPRILLADPDTGIGVGMTMFMGNTDMHMFKMYGGQVYAVHAILGGASSSGWD